MFQSGGADGVPYDAIASVDVDVDEVVSANARAIYDDVWTQASTTSTSPAHLLFIRIATGVKITPMVRWVR